MPSASVFEAVWADFIEKLGDMSVMNGSSYDYGTIKEDTRASFELQTNPSRPDIFVDWGGTSGPIDDIVGDEVATGRFRHLEVAFISFAVRASDGKHRAMAFDIRKDVHAILMVAAERKRGVSRAMTYDVGTDWVPGGEVESTGGLLLLTYHLRWDHISGDQTTAG